MKSSILLFFSIILVCCLQAVCSDIYAPSLTAVAHNLNTTFSMAKWSMAIYVITLALTHFIYGPLSEGIGRKKPLLIGLSIMTIGSLVCMTAPSIHVLLIGRLIQGAGAGATASLWRPICRDMFSGEQLAKIGSTLGVFVMLVVASAPALGGYLQHYFNWRASFIFLTLYATLTLLCVLIFFKETSQHHHSERLKLSYISATFKQLIIHPLFIGMTVCAFLGFGALFSWTTVAPILLIHLAGISPITYGWIVAVGSGTAFILGMICNSKYVEKFGTDKMVYFGLVIMFLAAITMITLYLSLGINAASIAAPPMLFMLGLSFIFPNTFARAFTPFGKIAGYAGALYSGIQTAGGAVLGSLAAHTPDKSPLPIAIIFLACTILIALIYANTTKYNSREVFSD